MKSFYTTLTLALLASASAATITTAPYSGAKFLVGQHFDLRVEVSDLKNPKNITVSLNGKAIQGFAVSKSAEGKQELTLRGYSLDRSGEHTLKVSVEDDNGVSVQNTMLSAVANYSGKAKNVIVFIGDGMGWNTVQAANLIQNGINPKNGTLNGQLEMTKDLGSMATVVTSSFDSFLADSANTAASIMSGQKIELNALNVYRDNTPDTLDNPQVETLAQMMKRTRGASVGIVTTTFGTDATPASVLTHTRRRGDYQAIADEYFNSKTPADVLLFGGSKDFIPKSAAGSRRKDETNWIDEAQKRGYTFVSDRTELLNASTPNNKLFGLFNIDNMPAYLDRVQTKDPAALQSFTNSPYLWDMTKKAIETLEKNENGYFLMVEAGMVDKFEHPLDWHRGVWDVLEFDKTVAMAKEYAANNPDTLVIVTADHAHSISTYGGYNLSKGPGDRNAVGVYADGGFPDYYKNRDENGISLVKGATTGLAVGFAATPDYCESYTFRDSYQDPTISDGKGGFVPNPKTCDKAVVRTGNLPVNTSQGVHTADPLPLFAFGAGAKNFAGLMDQTDIFFALSKSLGLNPIKEQR